MHIFKSCSREKSTQDEKVRFIKENEFKSTQVELLSIFKSILYRLFELILLISFSLEELIISFAD